jgi:hypothetical protein
MEGALMSRPTIPPADVRKRVAVNMNAEERARVVALAAHWECSFSVAVRRCTDVVAAAVAMAQGDE